MAYRPWLALTLTICLTQIVTSPSNHNLDDNFDFAMDVDGTQEQHMIQLQPISRSFTSTELFAADVVSKSSIKLATGDIEVTFTNDAGKEDIPVEAKYQKVVLTDADNTLDLLTMHAFALVLVSKAPGSNKTIIARPPKDTAKVKGVFSRLTTNLALLDYHSSDTDNLVSFSSRVNTVTNPVSVAWFTYTKEKAAKIDEIRRRLQVVMDLGVIDTRVKQADGKMVLDWLVKHRIVSLSFVAASYMSSAYMPVDAKCWFCPTIQPGTSR